MTCLSELQAFLYVLLALVQSLNADDQWQNNLCIFLSGAYIMLMVFALQIRAFAHIVIEQKSAPSPLFRLEHLHYNVH